MITIAVLILTGAALLAIEVVVPGGILGVGGGLFLLAGVVVSFNRYGPTAGSLTGLGAIAALGVALYLEFKVFPRSRLARKFSMTTTVQGQPPAELAPAADVVGCECVALTKLVPSGYVAVASRRYEAFCRSGAAAEGERLRVASVDNFRLIVTQIERSS